MKEDEQAGCVNSIGEKAWLLRAACPPNNYSGLLILSNAQSKWHLIWIPLILIKIFNFQLKASTKEIESEMIEKNDFSHI